MLYDIESTTFTRINYFGSHPLLTIVCYRKVLCIIDRCYLSNYFSLNKILGLCFCIFPRFLIRYGQLNFLLLLPCSHGLLVRLFIYLLSCQYRNPCKKLYSSLYFVALYFTRLLLSGFSLCITRIKNLFFF